MHDGRCTCTLMNNSFNIKKCCDILLTVYSTCSTVTTDLQT